MPQSRSWLERQFNWRYTKTLLKLNWKKYLFFLLFLPINSLLPFLKYADLDSCNYLAIYSWISLIVLLLGICFYGGAIIMNIVVFSCSRSKKSFSHLIVFTTSLLLTFTIELNRTNLDVLFMQKTIKNGNLIIEALKKHEIEVGKYPDNLESLIPKYLSIIPRTEICCTPAFNYQNHGSTGFHISVHYGLWFNALVYDPKKELTSVAKREGDWAFVYD